MTTGINHIVSQLQEQIPETWCKKIKLESINQNVTSEPAYVAETNSDDGNSKEPSDQSILEKPEISGNFVNKIHNFHNQNIDKSIEDNQLDCNLSKNDSSRNDDFNVPSEQ
ncbi:8892_t:CDS:2 [Funneliformis geosporum]|uniref:8892_t:CDS:1 n=1 Tax=Funneliformis geosporum TaxID=1117311 RepID=A0A9W4SN59_9GLOM|nr:8892_t:CDS:2 [Funneliformis geosporum]